MRLRLALVLVVPLVVGPLARMAAPAQPFPTVRAGVFAGTDEGWMELTVYGERSRVNLVLGAKNYYPPDGFDRIPTAESLRSFFVNMVNWTPSELYLVVGREHLTSPFDNFQRLGGRVNRRGAVAFDVVSSDLNPDWLRSASAKLVGRDALRREIEAFVVLELRSSVGLEDRCYPIRVRVPER